MFSRGMLKVRILSQNLRFAQISSQPEEEVLFHVKNSTGFITLNRPKILNTFTVSMLQKMNTQLLQWETDPTVGAVVIRGAGGKAFCAGGDILALTESVKTGTSLCEEYFRVQCALNYKIGTYKKPYIALMDGITIGGAFGLSVHGMFRVVTENTMFALLEHAIGFYSDVGEGYFLPRLAGKMGVYLALTGFRLNGRDVKSVGVATHFVEASKIAELEERLTGLPSQANRREVENVLNDFQAQSTAGSDKELVLQPHLADIDRLFAGQTLEKIFSDLERDGSQWATQQLETLKRMPPLSMKISLRLLLEGKSLDLREELIVENRVSQRIKMNHDFQEGVRAVLIDRDGSPKWSPGSLEEVTEEMIDHYFSPLGDSRELIL